jgi:hypothetical protein
MLVDVAGTDRTISLESGEEPQDGQDAESERPDQAGLIEEGHREAGNTANGNGDQVASSDRSMDSGVVLAQPPPELKRTKQQGDPAARYMNVQSELDPPGQGHEVGCQAFSASAELL